MLLRKIYNLKTNVYNMNIIILSLFFPYVNTQNLTIFDNTAEILKQYRQNIAEILLIKLLYVTIIVALGTKK